MNETQMAREKRMERTRTRERIEGREKGNDHIFDDGWVERERGIFAREKFRPCFYETSFVGARHLVKIIMTVIMRFSCFLLSGKHRQLVFYRGTLHIAREDEMLKILPDPG